ncbi:MAG: CheY-like chemotaxis protein [Myxococcota bacterium]|jgi:CheY-like chemotaxis protein
MQGRQPLIPPTILIVEDSPDDAMIVRMTFEETGIHNPLVLLEDGEQAIDYLLGRRQYADRRKHPLPLLMILDLNMPRFTGFQVLEAAAHTLQAEQIPVVVLSVSDSPRDVARAQKLGAAKVLQKPIDPGMLLRLISEITDLGLLLIRKPD